jgi:hypothetical protein
MAQSIYQQINTDPGKTKTLIQPQSWMLVSVSCDTVGPAIIGSNADLKLGSGQGVLITSTPRYLFVEPGETVYVFSAGTDRISIAMHPMSWITQLLAKLGAQVLTAPLAVKAGR